MKIRFASLIIATLTIRVFALSLGDNINANTIKVQTTPQSVMKLTKVATDHKEYTVTDANGTNVVLVNKSGVVYGFQWQKKSTNLAAMVGSKYESQFAAACANRLNKFNHRFLTIDTPNLSVWQFGLPGGPFQGTMTAKNLAP